jgi:uncharacterized protein YkwD
MLPPKTTNAGLKLLVSLLLLSFELNSFNIETKAQNISQRLFELINYERKRRGLLPLIKDPLLSTLALSHSLEMKQKGYLSHFSPSFGDPKIRVLKIGLKVKKVAENIVQAKSSQRAHILLMKSHKHRKNILDPLLTHVGIGVVSTYNKRERWFIITQLFVSK